MNKPTERIRLDQLLTKRGLSASRSRARDAIARGCVTVGGQTATKAGMLVSTACEIDLNDPASSYVSRSAFKLVAGLEAANIDVSGQVAVDLGASTGGFTQVLLERGAKSVLAIDVGHGQLVQWIADDPRVTSLEGVNARNLTREILTPQPDLIVSDVSFISLRQAAEPTLLLSASQAQCVLLVKPQFEVGRAGIAKGGMVKDPGIARQAVEQVRHWFENLPGWTVTKLIP
ncbi:MAG: TlyA family RNA methyltransferase, partial [Rhizobiaceae bacterium]